MGLPTRDTVPGEAVACSCASKALQQGVTVFVCRLFALDGYANRSGGLVWAQKMQCPAGDNLRFRQGFVGSLWLPKDSRGPFWNGTPIRFECFLGSRSLDPPLTSEAVFASYTADHQRRSMVPCGLRSPPRHQSCSAGWQRGYSSPWPHTSSAGDQGSFASAAVGRPLGSCQRSHSHPHEQDGGGGMSYTCLLLCGFLTWALGAVARRLTTRATRRK